MAKHPSKAAHPAQLKLSVLGVLTWNEVGYSCEKPPHIRSSRVAIAPNGVTLNIWPSGTGKFNASAFEDSVNERWPALVGRLDDILDNAAGLISETITEFWQIAEEPCPTLGLFLAKSELRHINLSTGREDHELWVYDGGLLGGHDLVLSVKPDLRPASACFDG